jgi:hypothetical protein
MRWSRDASDRLTLDLDDVDHRTVVEFLERRLGARRLDMAAVDPVGDRLGVDYQIGNHTLTLHGDDQTGWRLIAANESGEETLQQVAQEFKGPHPLVEALGCIYILLLFLLCLLGPHVAVTSLGAWWGMGGAILSLVLWARLGPSPMPGMLPGMLGVAIFFNAIVVFILGLVRLFV